MFFAVFEILVEFVQHKDWKTALQHVIPLRKQAGDDVSDTQFHHSHSRAEHDTPPESACSDRGAPQQTTPPGSQSPCCRDSRTTESIPLSSQSPYHDHGSLQPTLPDSQQTTAPGSQSPYPDHGSLQSTLPDSQFPCSDDGALADHSTWPSISTF